LTVGPQIKEIERQGLSPDGNIKRQILGEEIVKAIRFPLVSQKEFASVVPDCNILTMKEVGDMMKHYSDNNTFAIHSNPKEWSNSAVQKIYFCILCVSTLGG